MSCACERREDAVAAGSSEIRTWGGPDSGFLGGKPVTFVLSSNRDLKLSFKGGSPGNTRVAASDW